MQLPKRDDWIRIGYTVIGGGTAILWNKYLPLSAKGGGYIPPVVLASLVLMSEESGQTEKDVAAGILGYSSAAQAISFATKLNDNYELGSTQVSHATSQTSELAEQNPLEQQATKLDKIRAVTGTLGALADIVGRFKGN
jgi:hypothetical protein